MSVGILFELDIAVYRQRLGLKICIDCENRIDRSVDCRRSSIRRNINMLLRGCVLPGLCRA